VRAEAPKLNDRIDLHVLVVIEISSLAGHEGNHRRSPDVLAANVQATPLADNSGARHGAWAGLWRPIAGWEGVMAHCAATREKPRFRRRKTLSA
jgi:hypothetical protein